MSTFLSEILTFTILILKPARNEPLSYDSTCRRKNNWMRIPFIFALSHHLPSGKKQYHEDSVHPVIKDTAEIHVCFDFFMA